MTAFRVSLCINTFAAVVVAATACAQQVSLRKPQAFDPDAVLKDYAGDTLIAVSVHGHGDNGVLTGKNVGLNREKILEHVDCAQAVVFAAWPQAGGIWPKTKPASIGDFVFDTTTLDGLIEWARANDMVIAHHLFVGPNFYMPDWFRTSGYSAEELDQILQWYLAAALDANDNGQKVRSWNIVNEVFKSDNSGEYRDAGEGQWDCLWMKMGFEPDRSGLKGSAKINDRHPVFIRRAFEYAARHTNGKLEIRDYNISFRKASVTGEDGVAETEPNRKAKAFYQLTKHLLNSGAPIEAIGFQCHLNYTSDNFYRKYDFEDMRRSIQWFKRLGVEVYISELDVGLHWNECDEVDGIRVPNSKADFAKHEAAQPDTYYSAVKAMREGGADMISTWGLIDGTMANWRKGQKALLLDEQGNRKPAYQAMLRALYETMPE